MEGFHLYPAWKQAVKALIEDGLTYGDRVTREKLIDLCGIPRPVDIEDVQRFSLDCVAAICEIKDALLVNHAMLLVSDQRGAYTVVLPKDQTSIVLANGLKAVTREMQRMAKGVSFVNHDLLTDAQRAHNADAQAKVSRLADMTAPVKSELRRLL